MTGSGSNGCGEMDKLSERPDSSKRISRIDALRGVAILGVVSVHAIQAANLASNNSGTDLITEIFSLGRYGVELFFVISGCLLTSIYSFESDPIKPSYFRRRIGRIYPLWILFLVLYLLTYKFFSYGGVYRAVSGIDAGGNGEANLVTIIVLTLTFTLFLFPTLWNTVIPGGWSIQVEVIHYLLFPFMRKVGMQICLTFAACMNFLTFIFVLIQSTIASSQSHYKYFLDTWIRLGINSSFSFFLLGILGFQIVNYANGKGVLSFITENKAIPIFIFSFLCAPCSFGRSIEALGFISLSFILVFSLKAGRLFNFLCFAGRYSYFVYFAHFIFLDALVYFTVNTEFHVLGRIGHLPLFFIFAVLTLFLSLILGKLSMRFIEAPAMKFIDSFHLSKPRKMIS